MWDEGADSARAGAILDSLVAQISGVPSNVVANSLPPLTHRESGRNAEAAGDLPGQEASAVFGAVGGRPAFALARTGGGFGVFSVDPLKMLGETAEAGQPIRALALGSEGERDLLVTGGDDNTVWAWDLTGDEGLLHARGGHGGAVGAVTARVDLEGDDGLVYSGGVDGNIWGWGSRDGNEVGALTGHDRTVNALDTARVSGVGLLVSGGDDGTVRVWNTDTGESLRTFTPETEWINAVAITGAEERGLVAAAGSDHVIRVWNIATGAPTQVLRGHSGAVTGLAFLDLEGRTVLASCSYDGTIRTWDVAAGRALDKWPALDAWPAALAAVSSPGRAVLVTGGATGTVRVWDEKGTALRALTAEGGPVQALALAELGGKTVAAGGSLNGSLTLWDVSSGSVRCVIDPDDGPITSVAFGPAAGTVVCGTARGTVRIHSTADGTLQLVPTPHTDRILSLAFLPVAGGIVASAGADRTVRTWEAATGRPLLRLCGHEAGVTRLAAGQAGAVAALASADEDAKILVWDAVSGRRLLNVRAARPVSAMAFGAVDGVGVLAGAESHGLIRVWDVVSGEELVTLDASGTVAVTLTVCVLDDTTVLLVGTGDGTVRAWRLPDGAEMGEVSVAQTPLTLSFSPPETLHVAGSSGLSTIEFHPEVAGR
ncbi:WD40 repeat domain-containing protein [Streptomyces brevispora]|uniref:WD40 repeat domain-containing protein n=1 Tax=Streptomyces brevispora TaxID=887462 RepID=UPI002E347367|nr:WD40 repeat domain-containing protein [Streptomyces brevispora]